MLPCCLVLLATCEKKPQEQEETKELTLTVSPKTLDTFKAEDDSKKLVNITTTGTWTATPAVTWIHLDKTSGTGNGTLTVTVEPNTTEFNRTANILILSSLGSKEMQESVTVSQNESGNHPVNPSPAAFDGNKRSSTTYQLLIYTFADSDGDGVGDFKGIQSKLDYLDGLGVTALWLSPAHPTYSYHAYDVNDYGTVNPLYGTEADFKALVDAAHAKGIKIYMDYVLNHSGTGTTWFKSVKADPEGSPYRNYYVVSDNPDADVAAGEVDNYGGGKNAGMGAWHSFGNGNIGYKGKLHFKVDWTANKKYVTVTEGTDAAQSSNGSATKWLYIGNAGNVGLYETEEGIFEITLNVDTSWGFLVRTSTDESWPSGTKYGGKPGNNIITFGEPLELDNSGSPADIVFGKSTYYFASFAESMPDLNYGAYTECENSPAFQSIAATADRWITEFGVDGFRLDAVIWIYQAQIKANQRFLDQWYQHCNATWKAAGHSDDIFMVGEAWEGHGTEKQYYKGLISNFEFEYFGALTKAVNNGSGSSFASTVAGYIQDHKSQRADAITSIFMTNHDQDRASESFGRDAAKEKQAAAMLLTSEGKPFIYMGEELGYWGKTDKGDASRRQPMAWDKKLTGLCKFGLSDNHKSDITDYNMVKADISVETQEADENSLLNVYKTWSRLRNTYPALAEGAMSTTDLSGSSIASWYMTAGSQKLLVIHNVANTEKTVTVGDSMKKPVALLGTATTSAKDLTLGAHSSVVFEL